MENEQIVYENAKEDLKILQENNAILKKQNKVLQEKYFLLLTKIEKESEQLRDYQIRLKTMQFKRTLQFWLMIFLEEKKIDLEMITEEQIVKFIKSAETQGNFSLRFIFIENEEYYKWLIAVLSDFNYQLEHFLKETGEPKPQDSTISYVNLETLDQLMQKISSHSLEDQNDKLLELYLCYKKQNEEIKEMNEKFLVNIQKLLNARKKEKIPIEFELENCKNQLTKYEQLFQENEKKSQNNLEQSSKEFSQYYQKIMNLFVSIWNNLLKSYSIFTDEYPEKINIFKKSNLSVLQLRKIQWEHFFRCLCYLEGKTSGEISFFKELHPNWTDLEKIEKKIKDLEQMIDSEDFQKKEKEIFKGLEEQCEEIKRMLTSKGQTHESFNYGYYGEIKEELQLQSRKLEKLKLKVSGKIDSNSSSKGEKYLNKEEVIFLEEKEIMNFHKLMEIVLFLENEISQYYFSFSHNPTLSTETGIFPIDDMIIKLEQFLSFFTDSYYRHLKVKEIEPHHQDKYKFCVSQ